MKQEKTKKEVMFGCDSCLKQTKFVKDEYGINPFPYQEGWIYLFAYKIKILGTRINILDKHFCCLNCLNKYVKKRIEELKKLIKDCKKSKKKNAEEHGERGNN